MLSLLVIVLLLYQHVFMKKVNFYIALIFKTNFHCIIFEESCSVYGDNNITGYLQNSLFSFYNKFKVGKETAK